MARKVIVLALVLIAIVGLVSAESPAHAPSTSSNEDGGETSGDHDVIGNTDGASGSAGSDDVVEAPVGSEEEDTMSGAAGAGAAETAKSGASALQVSALAGFAATAAAGFFF